MRTKIDQNDARILFQSADMLAKHDADLSEAALAKENASKDLMTESAYMGFGASIHNKRVQTQTVERALGYEEHFTVVALTEALSKCAEDALLLNTEEYAKINPSYKDEIKATVRNFLENADINEHVNTEFAMKMFEEIKPEIPSADLYLTEEEEDGIVSSHIMNKDTVARKITDLTRDVRARVANIVTKDQEALKDQEDALSFADEKELAVAPEVPVSVAEPEVFADPDAVPAADEPVAQAAPAPVVQESVKLTIVKEAEKKGIVESLAINEAAKMLAEGKEYDRTLAVANAIKYITILETLDASGLVTIGEAGYRNILKASGVDTSVKESVKEAPIIKEEKEDTSVKDRISEIVRSSMPSGMFINESVFEPIAKTKKELLVEQEIVAPKVEDLHGKFTDMKGKVYTESQLREYFENQGFDLNYVDFEGLCESWHFKKH